MIAWFGGNGNICNLSKSPLQILWGLQAVYLPAPGKWENCIESEKVLCYNSSRAAVEQPGAGRVGRRAPCIRFDRFDLAAGLALFKERSMEGMHPAKIPQTGGRAGQEGAPFPGRRAFFAVCWLSYVCCYLCRVNMSSALSKLEQSLGVSSDALGLLGSLFFVVYAVGQLVNGFIGDRISPYLLIPFSILGTASLNLLISRTGSFWTLLVCWGLNGYFQSMLWGPLMRVLSERFPKEENANLALGMSTSIVTGFVLSWSVLGGLLADSPWQQYFRYPGLSAAMMLLVWIALAAGQHRSGSLVLPGRPAAAGRDRGSGASLAGLVRMVSRSHLWVTAAICICLGLVKESVNLWAPVILTQALHIDVESSFLFIVLIPLANFGGLLLARQLTRRFGRCIYRAVACFFGAAAVSSLLLAGVHLLADGGLPLPEVLLIAAVSASMNGVNSILLSFIPLSFAGENAVSTLVGLFDFSSYLGAAVSSFVLGMLLTGGNWLPITLIWMAVGMLAVLLSVLQFRRR